MTDQDFLHPRGVLPRYRQPFFSVCAQQIGTVHSIVKLTMYLNSSQSCTIIAVPRLSDYNTVNTSSHSALARREMPGPDVLWNRAPLESARLTLANPLRLVLQDTYRNVTQHLSIHIQVAMKKYRKTSAILKVKYVILGTLIIKIISFGYTSN